MGKKNKGQMPSSFGGLVRYFDEGEEKFQLDPKAIIVFIIGLVTMNLMAYYYLMP